MNTSVIAPEVQEFVTAVRGRLADLDPDEQREILDGLEADLTDLVAERGRGALGDPVAYARELRTAAGLDPEPGRVRPRLDLSAGVHAFLDDVRWQADRLARALPGDVGGLLASLQPVWWVLRAWIAVQLIASFLGDWSLTIVPGSDVSGLGAILAAVVASVQLGRGRLWPGERWRRVAALRLLLVAGNCFAVAMVPVVLGGLAHGRDAERELAFNRGVGAADRSHDGPKAGLYSDGRWISQIYPYDAKGRPLVGVQLFDQVGKPLDVVTQPEYEQPELDDNGNPVDAQGNPIDPSVPQKPRVYYPWTNGATQVLNVFPIPSRLQDGEKPTATAFVENDPPTVGPFPLASVPAVSLPGVKPGVLPSSR